MQKNFLVNTILVSLLIFASVSCGKKADESSTPASSSAPVANPTVSEVIKNNPIIQQGYKSQFACNGSISDMTGLRKIDTFLFDVSSLDKNKEVLIQKTAMSSLTFTSDNGKLSMSGLDYNKDIIAFGSSDISSNTIKMYGKSSNGLIIDLNCENTTKSQVNVFTQYDCTVNIPVSNADFTTVVGPNELQSLLYKTAKYMITFQRTSTDVIISISRLADNVSVGELSIGLNSPVAQFVIDDKTDNSRRSVTCVKK